MSDPVSLASATITLLSKATEAQEKTLESYNAVDEVKKVELDVKIGLHKFHVWEETWSGQSKDPGVTSEALWGIQGWANIRRLLDEIVGASRKMEGILLEFRELQKPHKARLKWKFAIKSVRSKKPYQADLRRLAGVINRAIDELWMYSETVFDSLHGIMGQELKLPNRDELLTSALQSRSGSLRLYELCAKSPDDCSLAMDLLDTRGHLCYQLFTQVFGNTTELKKLVIENAPDDAFPQIAKNGSAHTETSELQLFQPTTETLVVHVPNRGSGSPSCLRIPREPIPKVHLKATPDRLVDILDGPQSSSKVSKKERFSTGARIELAFKIVESGFFLMGTPWLSSLSSKSLRRMKSVGPTRYTFLLAIQTLDFSDLLFDDPEALAETSQLFRIGVLLIEIALGSATFSSRLEESNNKNDLISLLPVVEQSMGAQYCDATAFCLQQRIMNEDFRGPEKYDNDHFRSWESYLAEFLQGYYSHVYTRYANGDFAKNHLLNILDWRNSMISTPCQNTGRGSLLQWTDGCTKSRAFFPNCAI